MSAGHRGSRAIGFVLGATLGAACYAAVSVLAWPATQLTSALRPPWTLAAIGLCVTAFAVAAFVRRVGRVVGLAMSAALLAISVVVLISPVPAALVDGTWTAAAVLQVGARSLVAPVLAMALLVLSLDSPRTASRPD